LGDEGGAMATAETARLIREAIEFHLEGLRADGTPIPPPSTALQEKGTQPFIDAQERVGKGPRQC